MTERRQVRRVIELDEINFMDYGKAIDWLSGLDVPDDAYFTLETYQNYGDPEASLILQYYGYETDEEVAKRVEVEEAQQQDLIKQFLKLKKQLEGVVD